MSETPPELSPEQPVEKPKRTRDERRQQQALDVLRTLIRDRYLERFGREPTQHVRISFSLDLALTLGTDWALDFEHPALDQIDRFLEDAEATHQSYVFGRVYDFRQESASAEGCIPPDTRSVFAGYNSFGVPQWMELPQLLLRQEDTRVAELYAKPPCLLATPLAGKDLTRELLTSFGRGSKTYAILGQVVAGYFKAPEQSEWRGERIAMTLQAVEGRDKQNQPQLLMNRLCAIPPDTLNNWFTDGWMPGTHEALLRGEYELRQIQDRYLRARNGNNRASISKILGGIPSLMRRMASAMERAGRQTQRRTRHAQQRRQEKRPVAKAIEDASQAKREHIFLDLKSNAWIACGPHGRTHAFNEDGKLVTSFTLKPGGEQFRIRTRRWRRPDEGEWAQWQLLSHTLTRSRK